MTSVFNTNDLVVKKLKEFKEWTFLINFIKITFFDVRC